MLPDFLNEFRLQLESEQLEYVNILARPLPAGESLPLTQSKFLGQPYLPVGAPYPQDEKNQPMILLAQINFAETPALAGFPPAGLLQLFVSPTGWYTEDYQVRYYADATAAPQTDFSFLTASLYAESPIAAEHALTFRLATEYGNPEDCRSSLDFNGHSYYNYLQTLPKPQQEALDACCNHIGHKLGGYATFAQGDPRDYAGPEETDVQLLQIDVDEQIMFGDAGVAHLFISPAALAARQFEQAYFYWDCC